MRDEMIAMILLALALASSPFGSQNFLTEILIQVNFFKDHGGPIIQYSEFVSFTKLVINLGVITHFEMRTSNVNSKNLDLTNLRCPTGFQSQMIQGLSKKNFFFKLLIGQKYWPLQGELSNVLLFLKQWWEAPRTVSPSFPISSVEMYEIDSAVSPKFRIITV